MLEIDDVVYELSEDDTIASVDDLKSSGAKIQPTVVSDSKTYSVTGIRSCALWVLISNSGPIPPFLTSITPVYFCGVQPMNLGQCGARKARPFFLISWSDRGNYGWAPGWTNRPGPPPTSITIPDQFERICEGAFPDWTLLTSVHFGAGCRIRELDGFFRCGLTSVCIPASVEVIGEDAGIASGHRLIFRPETASHWPRL